MILNLTLRICELQVGDIAFLNGIHWSVRKIENGRVVLRQDNSHQRIDLGAKSQRWVTVKRTIADAYQVPISKVKNGKPDAVYSNSGHLNTIKKYS